MAVVFDPHQKQPGNKITGEPGTVIGTKYRMLVPKNGPFYTGSLVVKSGGKILKLAGDYVIVYPYMTAMQRTGRSAHGMIWLVNPDITSGITLDYHAIGLGGATTAQVNSALDRNKDVYPSKCQWEQVIGEVYFPPVDIQFDWENWKGERELMLAIGEIGKKMTQIIKLPNPLSKNLGTYKIWNGSTRVDNETMWDYNGSGKFAYKDPIAKGFLIIWETSNKVDQYKDYKLDFFSENPGAVSTARWVNRFLLTGLAGNTYLYLLVSAYQITLSLVMNKGSGSSTYDSVIVPKLNFEDVRAGVRSQITRNADSTIDILITTGGKTYTYRFDPDKPPVEFQPGYDYRDVASELKRAYSVQAEFSQHPDGFFTMLESPGAPAGDVADDMYSILVRYHQLVDQLYRDSPAIPHIADKNNPHEDDSYGRMRAIGYNGIASDATLAYGKTQPQLADYVNGKSAKASDFADKMFRSGADRTITGTFSMLPGLSSVTSSKDAETNGVGTNLQVDDKAVRLIARDSSTVNAGNNPITFKAGANSLVLYPDSRGLRWNNKIILDPTTVGQYLPGNSGGGDGIYYGKNSDTVTITGNGIEQQPFICTWVPPSDTNANTLAMRLLTNDFGTSEVLAATPALIQKLANEFTGKLEKSRAYINGMSLMSSVTLDKFTFNLGDVENTSDDNLPVSTLQSTEFAKYSAVGHTHDASAFGIGPATTAKAGTVKFGGLVNDPALALDGSYVVQQLKDIDSLETDAKRSDANSVIDILRYGTAGTDGIADGVTFTGWMVSIKANNYFVGLDYAVPLATFNLTELFPGAYEDTNFGIFVDLADNAAKYVIKNKSNLAEGDTLTRIGEIVTGDEGIETASVRNVTRLGDYRELDDHADNINAHTPRTMTEAEFGYTYEKGGLEWAGGGVSTQRGIADWRMVSPDGFVSAGDFDANGATFYLPPTAAVYSSLRWMVPVAEPSTVSEMKLTFNADKAGREGFHSLMLAHFPYAGKNHTLSFTMSNNGATTLSGKRSYVGFHLNAGGASQTFSFGLDAGEYLVPKSFADLLPVITYNRAKDNTEGIYFYGTIAVADVTMSYKLYLKGTPRLVVTNTKTNAVQTVDLTSRFTAAGVDPSAVATDEWLPVRYGIGGAYTDECAVVVEHQGFMLKYRYDTAINFLNNISELGRIRTLDLERTATPESVAESRFALAAKNPKGIPEFCFARRMIIYPTSATAKGIIFRN